MTQDPNAKARELFRTQWWSPAPHFEERFVEAIAGSITGARREALEEAAKVAEARRWDTQHTTLTSDPPQNGCVVHLAWAIRQLLAPEREGKRDA